MHPHIHLTASPHTPSRHPPSNSPTHPLCSLVLFSSRHLRPRAGPTSDQRWGGAAAPAGLSHEQGGESEGKSTHTHAQTLPHTPRFSLPPYDDSSNENFVTKKSQHSPTFIQLALPLPVTIEMDEDTQHTAWAGTHAHTQRYKLCLFPFSVYIS